MQIRRKLIALVASLFIVAAALAAGTTTAHAAITPNCDTNHSICSITEDMNGGYCQGTISQTNADSIPNPSGDFAIADGNDVNTGYTCNFFFQRNVNNTGWYDIHSGAVPNNGPEWESPNDWNGPGYQARVCLQFNWGSTLGDRHCSDAVIT
jgi:hypothetical protein